MSDGEVSRFVEGWDNRKSQLLIPLKTANGQTGVPPEFLLHKLAYLLICSRFFFPLRHYRNGGINTQSHRARDEKCTSADHKNRIPVASCTNQ